MDLTSSKFTNTMNIEEKNDRKLPSISKDLEITESNSNPNIKYTSAQNFYKGTTQNFTKGLTLEDYLKKSVQNNEEFQEKGLDDFEENRMNKFSNIKNLNVLNSKITEQSELSFETSEKKYLDASFEINESDEDLYSNSDSNSNISKNQKTEKKTKYEHNDNVIEEQLDIKKKIQQKYTNKKNLTKQQSQKLESNEVISKRDYDKKKSLKLKNEEENTEKMSHNGTNEKNNDDQRENRMKNLNKQGKKIYNSQSPPHSHILQNNIERRNFSKDAFAKQPQEDKIHNYSSKEDIESHIAYRNSYDPNKTHFLATGHLKQKKEEENKFFGNHNNNDFNKSSYNTKCKLTLNEFYKNQSKYQEFGNPMGPPAKLKSWNSMNNENQFEKKYCNKEKINEKMKNEDINFISKYASKFRLNEEECMFLKKKSVK